MAINAGSLATRKSLSVIIFIIIHRTRSIFGAVLLTGGLLVRIQPEEPISSFAPIRKHVERLNAGGRETSAIECGVLYERLIKRACPCGFSQHTRNRRFASLPADCGWLDFITVRRSYAVTDFRCHCSAVWRVRDRSGKCEARNRTPDGSARSITSSARAVSALRTS